MTDTTYQCKTPQAVRNILENARATGRRLRLFYGDRDTGRDWLEENDVLGTIGRSTGDVKVPLLIPTARSMGGTAILCDCIVRIVDAKTKRELYVHPKYHLPTLAIQAEAEAGYSTMVTANDAPHAQFRTEAAAARYVAFMRGERMAK